MVLVMVEPSGLEPLTGPCEGPVIPLNYGPKTEKSIAFST